MKGNENANNLSQFWGKSDDGVRSYDVIKGQKYGESRYLTTFKIHENEVANRNVQIS